MLASPNKKVLTTIIFYGIIYIVKEMSYMFTKLYEVRLTFIFDEGGRPKSQIYRVKAKNSDTAILAAKKEFYDFLGYPTPDGKLEISYCVIRKGA